MQIASTNAQPLETLNKVGATFGFGELISVSKIDSQSLHSVYRCDFSCGRYSVKKITKRPNLPRWKERFESAFAIETWVSKHYSFLPKPIANIHGDSITVIHSSKEPEQNDWYIAHQWIEGDKLDHRFVNRRTYNNVGAVVSAVATTPSALIIERVGMDDETPDIEEIVDLVQAYHSRDTLLRRKCSTLNSFASIFSSVIAKPQYQQNIVVGHRDLSPANALLSCSGSLTVLDWENAGPTTLELELGRAVIHWCMEKNIATDLCVRHILEGLAHSVHELGSVSEWWFSSWLQGHLMYLRYLISTGERRDSAEIRKKIHSEVAMLSVFISRLPILVRTLRDSLLDCRGKVPKHQDN